MQKTESPEVSRKKLDKIINKVKKLLSRNFQKSLKLLKLLSWLITVGWMSTRLMNFGISSVILELSTEW